MQFLSPGEAATWASNQGYPFKQASLERDGFVRHEFKIPSDAGRRVALARLLWESTAQGRPEALLWVTEWSVWPSGEHMPLAAVLRHAFGEEHSLAESPGHLFRLGEDDHGITFLSVALLFLWDAYLLAAGGEVAVFVSHDEYGVVLSRNPDAGLPVQRRLAIFNEAAT